MRIEVGGGPAPAGGAQAGAQRRSPAEVLGKRDSGASQWGATYRGRLMSCPRKHLLANELRVFPAKRSDALDTGLAVHEVLEAFYRALYSHQQGGDPKVLRGVAEEALRVADIFEREPGYEEIAPVVSRITAAYIERYLEADAAQFKVLGVEVPVDLPLPRFVVGGAPVRYSARFDLVAVTEIDGKPATVVVEHKTTRALSSQVVEGYHQDLQVMGQAWLATRGLDWSKYPPFGGVLVNIMSKGRQPKFLRTLVAPSEEQLLGWENALKGWTLIEAAARRADYPPNLTACKDWGGCDYRALCAETLHLGAASLRERLVKRVPDGYRVGPDDGIRR